MERGSTTLKTVYVFWNWMELVSKPEPEFTP